VTTPANLRAIRLRIGMSFEEAASLLGYDPKTYGPRERAKSINVFERDVTILHAVEGHFNAYVDRMIEAGPRAVLVGYMNENCFQFYEPGIAKSLVFNSVHRMALAMAQDSHAANGLDVPIVELVPELYAKWLESRRLSDSPLERQAWAVERLKAFRTIPAPK
jgi:transcriptional regulator with XRE-family HTH domain